MRIALLADVHANLPALTALIAHASSQKIDEFWDLGDMAGYAPFPNEAIALLRKTCSRHIAGNYDIKCVSPDHLQRVRTSAKDKDKVFSFEWTARALSAENISFIQSLPSRELIGLEGVKLMLVHGSPAAADDPLTPRTPAEKLRAFAREVSADGIRAVLFGHTHEFVDRLVEGVRFINPGGVGRSFDGDPRAAYCVLDISGEVVKVERYRVDYSREELVEAMRAKGFSDRLMRSLIEARSLEELDGLGQDKAERLLSGALELGKLVKHDLEHAVQVTKIALRLFDELKEVHGLGWRERAYLNAAALMHDVGWVYGQEGHHKASRDLILKDQSLPLDARERMIVALTARYHRRSLPEPGHKYYKDLSVHAREVVGVLAGILRIADGLDCSHHSLVQDVSVSVGRVRIVITPVIKDGADISEELASAKAKADLLEKIFGLEIIFKK